MNAVNFITPMQGWNFTRMSGLSRGSAPSSLASQQATQASQVNSTDTSIEQNQPSEGANMFADVVKGVVDNVKTTQADVEQKQYELATGQLDDPHSLPIAEAKAQVSLDMMIALRNKAMESYNEIMKMSV